MTASITWTGTLTARSSISHGGQTRGTSTLLGKVVPVLTETMHITGVPTQRSAFTATQLESYTRQSDTNAHDFVGVVPMATDASLAFDETGRPEPVVDAGGQMLFNIETFPAGTEFVTWLRLRRPTPLELAFFVDVLDRFRTDGYLGGRVAIGHGRVDVDLTCAPSLPDTVDWRAELVGRRDEILDALSLLT